MYSPKVQVAFLNLEKQAQNIRAEIDSFVGNISEWADGLVELVEKECAADKDNGLFLLPKTPSEMKTRKRKGRNELVSKCSVVNSTFLNNETNNLDETVSTRTRGARRAATSKMSQLNITRDLHETHHENTKEGTLAVGENDKELSNATFVMPKPSTRTKPVMKNKNAETTVPEPEVPELEKVENDVFNKSTGSSEKESPPKKISRTGRTPPERVSRRTLSRTLVGNSAEELQKTPVAVLESPVQSLGRRKVSRTLSGSPAERQSSRKMFRNLSGSPVVRSSSAVVPRSPSKSPIVRSSSLRSGRNVSSSSRNRRSNSGNKISNQSLKVNTPDIRGSLADRTVTIKKESTPIAASTFVIMNETVDDERTPIVKEGRFFRLSKTSTPAAGLENMLQIAETGVDHGKTRIVEESIITNESDSPSVAGDVSQNAGIPKKKRKTKKDEEVKENIAEVGETMRITRTKSKAIKQMMEENETRQADLSAFAKKLLNKAKMTSVKKNQLAALLECNTPTNDPGLGSSLPFGNLTTSKSKYHLLLSGSKKLKTPLAILPNSAIKIAKGSSSDKDRLKSKVGSRDSSTENTVRSVTKPAKTKKSADLEKEMKLRSKKEKEEEAALKRQNVIKSKQEELKRKNELKHQMAMKQREKLEQEKYQNRVLLEKEKEERHKVILQERQAKLKEETYKKKMLTQQKIAETVERRRLEEEARIAKLKEMEAEEQRLALEKQKEQERQEKRAQERLAQKKAREEYEMQLKQEQEAERLRAEKLLTAKKGLPNASKLQSASKRQKFGIFGEKREWDYKPRNEHDFGLDEEHSEVDSEDEKAYDKTKSPMPWGKKILNRESPTVKILTLEMLCEFMPCYQKSPDIHKMFKMTPSKRIKRTSSAIWNTPSS